MNDLFNHIKSELDQPINHPIDEAVWKRVESGLPQRKRYIIPLWLMLIGVFALGVLLSSVWLSNDYEKKIVRPIELQDSEQVSSITTIYKYDTIYLPQESSGTLLSQQELLELKNNNFDKESQLLKSSLLKTQLDFNNLLVDYALTQRYLSEARHQLTEQLASKTNLSTNIDEQELKFQHPLLIGDSKINIEPMEVASINNSLPTQLPWLTQPMDDDRPSDPWRFAISAYTSIFSVATSGQRYLQEINNHGFRVHLDVNHPLSFNLGIQYRDYFGIYKNVIPTSLLKPERVQKRTDLNEFIYHIDYLDLPFQLQYRLNSGNTDFSLYGTLGIQFSKLIDYEAEYKFTNGDAFIHSVHLLNSSWGLKAATLGIGTSYNIQPSFSLYMEGIYRRQLSLQGLEFEKNHNSGIILGLKYKI